MRSYRLTPHPHAPAPQLGAPLSLDVRLEADSTHWRLLYLLRAAPERLRLPARHPAPGAADGLWQHTCFELFVGQAGHAGYLEFNFSPSGQWAWYAFAAQRQRRAEPLSASRLAGLRQQLRLQPDGLVLDVQLPRLALALWPDSPMTEWRLGLCAVLEDQAGQLSHWALHHPGPVPDFHHPGGWTALAPVAADSLSMECSRHANGA